jgi:hypothetical protein
LKVAGTGRKATDPVKGGAARADSIWPKILHAMTCIDFSSNPPYMDEFTSALFLPHTNVEMFPGVL